MEESMDLAAVVIIQFLEHLLKSAANYEYIPNYIHRCSLQT